MLNELQPDLRQLIKLVQKVENYDATLAAMRSAGKPIEPEPKAREERRLNEQRIIAIREKWGI